MSVPAQFLGLKLQLKVYLNSHDLDDLGKGENHALHQTNGRRTTPDDRTGFNDQIPYNNR